MASRGEAGGWWQIISFCGRWIALVLAGGLAYVGVCALWLTIQSGAPLYDWQWYIALIGLLVLLLAQVSFYLPLNRKLKLVYGGLLVWLLIGWNGPGHATDLPLQNMPSLTLSFWISGNFWQPSPALLTDLQAAQATLYIRTPLPLEGENRTYLADLLHQLESYSISAVLFVPASDFLSVPVYAEWMENVEETAAFVYEEGITNVQGFIGDAESPQYNRYAWPSNSSPVEATTHQLGTFLQKFQQTNSGLPVGVTASWPLYLDKLDGDNDLAKFYQTAVDPPGNWGFVSVMNYTSYYPPSWRPYLLARIIWGMDGRFPGQAPAHLIGIVGGGFPWEPVLDFEGVIQDARLSRALGVREVVIFQLRGAMEKHGENFVKDLNTAVNQTDAVVSIPFSRLASVWLYGLAVLDATFDLFVSRWWLTAVWVVLSFAVVWRGKR